MIVGASVVYLLPLLLSNRSYVDDMGRTLEGYATWRYAGRPLADVIMAALNLGTPLVDLSPLTQLLGVSAVGLASFYLYRMLDHDEVPLGIPIIASCMLLFNPFFLECMSYKFDSLPMGLSVGLAVLASLPGDRSWLSLGRAIVSLVAARCLYQVSANLVPALGLITAIAMTTRGENAAAIGGYLGRVAVTFVAALLIYWMLTRLMTINEYGASLTSPLPAGLEGARAAAENVVRSALWVASGFSSVQLALLLVGLTLAWVYSAYLGILILRGSGALLVRAGLALLFFLAPILLSVCWFGLSNLFAVVFFAPRLFIGVGATAVYLAYFASLAVYAALAKLWPRRDQLWRKLSVAVCAAPLVFAATVAYGFGTAQAAQQRFEDVVITQIIEALDAHGTKEGSELAIVGIEPFAPDAAPQAKKFPLFDHELIPRYLRGGWSWARWAFQMHGFLLSSPTASTLEAASALTTDTAPFYEDHLLALYDAGNGVAVRFKK